jgi:hypothetical protein
MYRNDIWHDPRHLGVPSGASKMVYEPMVCSAQTMHLSYPTLTQFVNRPKRDSTWPMSPRCSIACVQNCFRAYGMFGATMHLYYTNTNTISKQTELRFDMTYVTKEFQWVHPKWFLSLWYVRRRPCTYLTPTLTQFSNRPKWDSTWPTSPRGSIGCVQNGFRVYGTFGATMHQFYTNTNIISKQTKMRFDMTHIT